MELIFGMLFLLVVLATSGIYFSDRSGWNATFKRISRMTRASLESKKEAKLLEKLPQTEAKDAWTAQFEGKEIEAGPKHEIIRTWYAKFSGELRPYWKCKCGHSDWHLNIDMASSKSKEHVREQNAADALLARNGGTHAW